MAGGKIANPSKRDYNPIWVKLKQEQTVLLKVAPHNFPTVKKAVIKEKDLDTLFKMQSYDSSRGILELRSSYNSLTWELTLTLVSSPKFQLRSL